MTGTPSPHVALLERERKREAESSPRPQKPEEEGESKDPDAAAYTNLPSGRIGNKALLTIYFDPLQGDMFFFPYLSMTGPGRFNRADHLILRFTNDEVWEVAIQGKQLMKLLVRIGDHRQGIVRESAAEDAANAGDEAVVTKIELRLVTRPQPPYAGEESGGDAGEKPWALAV